MYNKKIKNLKSLDKGKTNKSEDTKESRIM